VFVARSEFADSEPVLPRARVRPHEKSGSVLVANNKLSCRLDNPYAKTATVAAKDRCAGCHIANATAHMVFTKFYAPILGAKSE
jgi:hypothetical protein